MAGTTTAGRIPGAVDPGAPSGITTWQPPFAAASGDAWPRTNRWIPWLLAGFLVMVWLVPFDSTELRVSLPFDAKLDRLYIIVLALVWLPSVLAGGRGAPRWRRTPFDALMLLFVGVAVLSVVLNVAVLARLDEIDLATKKLSVLFSWVVLFLIAATSLRPREIPRFVNLFLGLAVLSAAGALWQRYVGPNLFFDWWRSIVPEGVFSLKDQPKPTPFEGFKITGPARHPLALAAAFAMAISFAAIGLAASRTLGRRLVYGAAFVILLAAIFATGRKTGSYAGLAAIATLVALRPKEMFRLAPAALVVFLALFALSPGAVSFQLQQIDPAKITGGASGEGRQSDYEAIVPDVRKYTAVGRGYGTYDPNKYRILDNNYIGLMIEVGLVGLALFGAMILAVPAVAMRAARAADLVRAGPAVGAACGAAAFGIAMALFDALAFPQVPYMFFFLGAVAVVSRTRKPAERREALPPLVERERRADEALPPLEDRKTEVLPALTDQLDAQRAALRAREQTTEHGGRPRNDPARKRPARGAPIREHVARPPAGSPDAEAHREPGRPGAAARVRAGIASARVRSARAARGTAGKVMVGLVALAVTALAFGRGGTEQGPAPQLGQAGAGGDPMGLDEFDAGSARGRGGSQRKARGGQEAEAPSARSRGGRPELADVRLPAPSRPTEPRERGERPGRDEDDSRRRRPRPTPNVPPPGGGERPVEEQPPQNDPGAEPARDCLPGEDTELLLIRAGLAPCEPLPDDTGSRLGEALRDGRLSAEEAAYLVDMLRRSQAASRREAPGSGGGAPDADAAAERLLPPGL